MELNYTSCHTGVSQCLCLEEQEGRRDDLQLRPVAAICCSAPGLHVAHTFTSLNYNEEQLFSDSSLGPDQASWRAVLGPRAVCLTPLV